MSKDAYKDFTKRFGLLIKKHPTLITMTLSNIFFDKNDCYICEVRYGNATANALQRGLWTNTKNATPFFDSVTNGWVDYSHNLVLVKLFSHALVSSAKGHETALEEIKSDIVRLKQENGINA